MLTSARAAQNPARTQKGLSLVEMMVGIAIGLIVVAAASLMVAGQLADNRRLLLETQLQQDLRAAADLITRELRRAGYWADSHRSMAASAELLGRMDNPYRVVSPEPGQDSTDAVVFSYATPDRPVDNNAVDDDERLGFRLSSGTLQTQLGSGNWQALTDPAVMRVTQFVVQPLLQEVVLECALACSPGGTLCPPRQQLRSYVVSIQAEAVHDTRVQRSIRTRVRLRNDQLLGECRD